MKSSGNILLQDRLIPYAGNSVYGNKKGAPSGNPFFMWLLITRRILKCIIPPAHQPIPASVSAQNYRRYRTESISAWHY